MLVPCADSVVLESRRLASLDDKIRALIDDPREALDPATRTRVLAHIAGGKFGGQEQTVSAWSRVGPYMPHVLGKPHPSRPGELLSASTVLNSLEWHVVKHTAQGEWLPGTTTQEYLDDIRMAVLHSKAVLDVGRPTVSCGPGQSRPSSRAGVRTETAGVTFVKAVPLQGYTMLTIYDAGAFRIRTGYQLKTQDAEITLARWANRRTFP